MSFTVSLQTCGNKNSTSKRDLTSPRKRKVKQNLQKEWKQTKQTQKSVLCKEQKQVLLKWIKNQLQKTQILIHINKQTGTCCDRAGLHSQIWNLRTTQQFRGHTHLTVSTWCWCVTTKHSPSNHDESMGNWMIQTRVFKVKLCVGGRAEGWVSPPKPSLRRAQVSRTRLES